jgi:hypothetical protein
MSMLRLPHCEQRSRSAPIGHRCIFARISFRVWIRGESGTDPIDDAVKLAQQGVVTEFCFAQRL